VNRALDVAAATLGLVVMSPVLAAAAAAIKLEDGGPMLFRQTRVGRDGVDFELRLLGDHGFQLVGMGARTLRSDTACVALLALLHEAIRTSG